MGMIGVNHDACVGAVIGAVADVSPTCTLHQLSV